MSKDYTDRYRHRHHTESRPVKEFRIQYEAFIENHWRPIVRYDTAHGRPHKDMMHPDGSETKEYFFGYTPGEALTYEERDIKRRWLQYREQYEREMKR
ncbi:MAG: hypothetical protein U9R15_02560 [Chloroflexota bacterium]|nr:hypothetical protein [Chloroflexota bacterium]